MMIIYAMRSEIKRSNQHGGIAGFRSKDSRSKFHCRVLGGPFRDEPLSARTLLHDSEIYHK